MWEFAVANSQTSAFEAAYGKDGPWVRLFRQDAAYLGTSLLRSRSSDSEAASAIALAIDFPIHFPIYLTVDRWVSREAYEAFLELHRAEYAAIDAEGAALTVKQRLVGSFTASNR